MRWVTQQNIQIDRMAAGWLICRFADPGAEVVFVPKGDASSITDGIPFHFDGAEFSNRDGLSTFETIVRKYGLAEKDPVLATLGPIVRAANDMHGPIRWGKPVAEALPADAPAEAALLHAALHGARSIAKTDDEALSRASAILDAVYAGLALRGKITHPRATEKAEAAS